MTRGQLDGLVVLAALVSVQLAGELTTGQLELLSAFFEVLGDNLALLALQPDSGGQKRPGIQ